MDQYSLYNKEELNLYISSLYVFLSSLATALGTFFGSFASDKIGYTWALTDGGMLLIGFSVLYAFFCGAGENNIPRETLKEK